MVWQSIRFEVSKRQIDSTISVRRFSMCLRLGHTNRLRGNDQTPKHLGSGNRSLEASNDSAFYSAPKLANIT